MKLRRNYCSEGFLAFWLVLETGEVAACETALGRKLEFRERYLPEATLEGIYEIDRKGLEIAAAAWLPPRNGQEEDPLTRHLRPQIMPLIEAELAMVEKERDRALVAEAEKRGWVVIDIPNEGLRRAVALARAGDDRAMAFVAELGADFET